LGADELGVERMGGFDEFGSQAGDEAVVGCFSVGGGFGGTKQLLVGRFKSFGGIG
jgi:hypothetical protein